MTTEISIRCQRCGEDHELWVKEIPATHDDPSEEYVEELDCSCGCYITGQEDSKVGIYDALEDYVLKEGFLFDEEENRFMELSDILDASEELKYFIKSEKPKDFEPFKLWYGKDVKP